MSTFLQAVCRPENLRNAIKISAVVGTVLNIINQGQGFLSGGIEWKHVMLNYIVPFLVASYSAGKARLSCKGENTGDS